MEVFALGYGRRPSLAEGLEAARNRKLSIRSRGSDDGNTEESFNVLNGEIVSSQLLYCNRLETLHYKFY
jgi:hypothetical protein